MDDIRVIFGIVFVSITFGLFGLLKAMHINLWWMAVMIVPLIIGGLIVLILSNANVN